MAGLSAPLSARGFVLAVACLAAAPSRAQDAPPRAEAEAQFKAAQCKVPFAEALANAEPFDLERGRTLYKIECWRSAFQSGSILLMTDGKGGTKPLSFSAWDGKKFEPALSLAEVDYVPQNHTLTSFLKGNREAECGSIGVWNWTGSEFRMTGYWYKSNCDGYQLEGQQRYRIR